MATRARATIGIVADTHGYLPAEALEALAGVDRILHAGDIGGDHILEALEQVAPVYMVGGNNDPEGLYPTSGVLDIYGRSIHLSHGHELDAKGWWLTAEKVGRRYGGDIAVFGHTHKAVTQVVGTTLVINPGAVLNGSLAILDLATDVVRVVKVPKFKRAT